MFDTFEQKMSFAMLAATGKITGITATNKADGHTWDMITFNPIGVRGGWCSYPVNFDPVWVECRLPLKEEE
jgi:hypothetical protein